MCSLRQSARWSRQAAVSYCSDLLLQPKIPLPVIAGILPVVADQIDAHTLAELLRGIDTVSDRDSPGARVARFSELFDALGRDGRVFAKILRKAKGGAKNGLVDGIRRAACGSRKVAADRDAATVERQAALKLLGHGVGNDREDYKLIASLLTPQTPDVLQTAAMKSLASGVDPTVARVLLKPWKGYSPALRARRSRCC